MSLSAYTRTLKQTATYWASLGKDEFGKRILAAPVTIVCRWEKKSVLFKGSDNKEHLSSSIVFCLSELDLNGFLALGDYTGSNNPYTLKEAKEIKQVNKSPDLSNSYNVVKVLL